jgi:hypothetical protein
MPVFTPEKVMRGQGMGQMTLFGEDRDIQVDK